MSNCKELWIARKTSTSPNRRERPLIIRITGWGTSECEERQRDRKIERKIGREGAVLYEKGG